jgi:hypothetical protein
MVAICPSRSLISVKTPGSWLTDFIRYHVLIRVFDGDVDAWLVLAERGGGDADVPFLRWLKNRLREDRSLLPRIQEEVDASGLWPSPPPHQ